jgi:hypothetical protein
MDTWVIVLIVVVAVVALVLLAAVLSRRSGAARARKREQAREHLREAEVRGARADKEHALAEEEAARARRELAEAQERAALAEQESRDRVARAGEDRAAADELRLKAEKLAPDVSTERPGGPVDRGAEYPDQPRDGTIDPGAPSGGATRR